MEAAACSRCATAPTVHFVAWRRRDKLACACRTRVVQETKQFVQLKQMMQAKSQEVVALRKRLERYEPQNVPTAD